MIKLLAPPLLVEENTVQIESFTPKFDDLILKAAYTSKLDLPSKRLTLKYDERAQGRIDFIYDWVTLLLMDPMTKERKSLYGIEYSALVNIDGTQYLLFPASSADDTQVLFVIREAPPELWR